MNIYINNKLQDIPGQPNIKEALQTLDITTQKGIAVAVNSNVVPSAEWEQYVLQANDKMILIKATQGG